MEDNYDDDIDDALDEMVGSPSDPDAWPGALPKQAAFLTALVICAGHKGEAAKAARISRRMHYKWAKEDQNYPKLFEEADSMAADVMLDEAKRRAHRGVRKAIYWQGKRIGHELIFSDSLMLAMLRARFPEFRERGSKVQASLTTEGGSIQIEFVAPMATDG